MLASSLWSGSDTPTHSSQLPHKHTARHHGGRCENDGKQANLPPTITPQPSSPPKPSAKRNRPALRAAAAIAQELALSLQSQPSCSDKAGQHPTPEARPAVMPGELPTHNVAATAAGSSEPHEALGGDQLGPGRRHARSGGAGLAELEQQLAGLQSQWRHLPQHTPHVRAKLPSDSATVEAAGSNALQTRQVHERLQVSGAATGSTARSAGSEGKESVERLASPQGRLEHLAANTGSQLHASQPLRAAIALPKADDAAQPSSNCPQPPHEPTAPDPARFHTMAGPTASTPPLLPANRARRRRSRPLPAHPNPTARAGPPEPPPELTPAQQADWVFQALLRASVDMHGAKRAAFKLPVAPEADPAMALGATAAPGERPAASAKPAEGRLMGNSLGGGGHRGMDDEGRIGCASADGSAARASDCEEHTSEQQPHSAQRVRAPQLVRVHTAGSMESACCGHCGSSFWLHCAAGLN